MVAESDAAGNLLKSYVYLDARPLAVIEATGNPATAAFYFIHTDHLDTPQQLTDAQQTSVWQADYAPFGKATVNLQTVTNNLRFPGQYFDAETGLHYNHHRYYDPRTGRYITSDPIGLEGGINTYAYVGRNPVNWIDPLGLDEFRLYSWGMGFRISGQPLEGGTVIGGPLDPLELFTRGIEIGAVIGASDLAAAKYLAGISKVCPAAAKRDNCSGEISRLFEAC